MTGAAILAAALAAAAPAFAQTEAYKVEAGRIIAERNCSQCHAISGRGPGPMPAAPPFRDLVQSYDMDQLELAVRQGLLSTHPSMPELRLTNGELDELVAYLRSLRPELNARLNAAALTP